MCTISGVARVSLSRRAGGTIGEQADDRRGTGMQRFFSFSLLTICTRQVAFGFADFLAFFGLALTGFRAFAGLILRGLAALTGAADRSGRKCARQPGLSWDLFWIMQTVMRSTSGM
jgi:hypothetical protein